jgi:hypothetical protein
MENDTTISTTFSTDRGVVFSVVVAALLLSQRSSCCRGALAVVGLFAIMRIGDQLFTLRAAFLSTSIADDLIGSLNSFCCILSVPRPHLSPDEVPMQVAVQITSA